FKQMLMAAGFDRYYQIARCFRDEDLRADRQPEFTQVDVEMSFVAKNDIQSVMERLIQRVWSEVKGIQVEARFPHLSFAEATSKHVIAEVLVIPDGANIFSTKELGPASELIRNSQNNRESKLTTVHKINDKGITGLGGATLLSRWLSLPSDSSQDARLSWLLEEIGANQGDLVFVSERSAYVTPANTTLGRVRTLMAKMLQSKGRLDIPKDKYTFLWVEDFPLFTCEVDDAHGELSATHHPFTAPIPEDIPLLYTDPAKVHGQHYDLVLNGVELGGGSIRVHDPKIQSYIFKNILKLSPTVQASFDHLVAALGHGCPPHGGIALGLDRLLAIITDSSSLRDVIAFPKSASGRDLFMHSPAPATTEQLTEYGLQTLPIPRKQL
ncbi:aspartate--tRNA ligase msd1, partial [Dipsacomyces acuminosporus]